MILKKLLQLFNTRYFSWASVRVPYSIDLIKPLSKLHCVNGFIIHGITEDGHA